MFDRLKNLFGKATVMPPSAPQPTTPLEILVPDENSLTEAPKIAGKTLSFLVAAPQAISTIEFDSRGPRAHSSDGELRQFLAFIVGAGQLQALEAQLRSIMFSPSRDGSIGSLGCLQQGLLYSFDVFELSPLPDMKWEIHRTTRPVQMDGA